MNKIPEVVKHSQLLKRLVLDRETVEDQGCIEELCLDSQSHQVIGFICKSGLFGKHKKYFAWKQIEVIGADATLVNEKPQPDNWEKDNNIVNIIGNEIWTDTGEKVGFIVEYILNIETGVIVNYLFKSNGWRGVLNSVYLLEPEAVSSAGNKRVIVVNSAVKNPQHYTGWVTEKLGLLQNFLQADLVRTREHIDLVRGETKRLTLGFQQRSKLVNKQDQEKNRVVREQAKQKVEYFPTKEKKNRKTQATTDEFSTKIQKVTIEAKEKIDGVKSQGIKIFNSSKDKREKNTNDLPT